MIDLVRGNILNLEGKVLVYSKIRDNEEFSADDTPFLVSIYATDDLNDFIKTFSLSKSVADKLRDEGKKLGDYEPNELDIMTQNSKDRQLIIPPFYSGELLFYEEDELLSFGHDIVYTGEFYNILSCDRANSLGIDFYQVIYTEQKSLANKVSDAVFNQELSKMTGMKSYINKKFVNPMIGYAASTKPSGQKSYDRIKNEFLEFAAGKMYDEDVLELSDIIKEHGKLQDYKLISAYIDKIDALNRENFELAAKMRDEIKKLKK